MVRLLRVFTAVFLLMGVTAAWTQSKAQPPPSPVVVSKVERGTVQPQSTWVGTAYFVEVSEVAAELSGKVEKVHFEEGDRVKRGEVLVELDTALREKELAASKAMYQEAEAELRKKELDFERIEKLYKSGSVAQQTYDDTRYDVQVLQSRAVAQSAEVARLEIELNKTGIKAPFDGVVINKKVDIGEWLDAGSVAAAVANDSLVEVVVNVPEQILPLLAPGMVITANITGKEQEGRLFAIIAKGDIPTRTFPVKLRIANPDGTILEGMEAQMTLPTGREVEGLLVNRDAVISKFGKQVIFTVADGAAHMMEVTVLGYRGSRAGIKAEGLSEGMIVIVKGQERLQEGQPVAAQNQ